MTDVHLVRHRAECERLGCVEFFDHLIEEGNNSGFAAMLAQRRPPGSKGTDRTFLEGAHNSMDKVGAYSRDRMLKMAKKAGISTQGKVYKGGIGRPDDPMAWVSGTSDVLAACKAKGLTCTGAVNYQAPKQQAKKKDLADDIRDSYVGKILATEPKTLEKVKKNPKTINEVRERVVAKHGNKRAGNS